MSLSISHDSEVEAFVFPFLFFFEVSLALGAINDYGKIKKLYFYHTDERIIYTLFGIIFSMFLVGSSYF